MRSGFNKVVMKVLERVHIFVYRCRKKYDTPEKRLPLLLTGHSLGGAIATLALAYFTFDHCTLSICKEDEKEEAEPECLLDVKGKQSSSF